MLKFCDVINCIFVHPPKKLTLVKTELFLMPIANESLHIDNSNRRDLEEFRSETFLTNHLDLFSYNRLAQPFHRITNNLGWI
jgi:hypothetical protein